MSTDRCTPVDRVNHMPHIPFKTDIERYYEICTKYKIFESSRLATVWDTMTDADKVIYLESQIGIMSSAFYKLVGELGSHERYFNHVAYEIHSVRFRKWKNENGQAGG